MSGHADILDQAAELEATYLAQALLLRKPTPAATGACLYCEAHLEPALKFCDSACRDAWDHEQARLAVNSR
jgi:hypothetical protein